MWYQIATLDTLSTYSSFGFEVATATGVVDGFLVRDQNHTWYAYYNVCPHQGLPLNWNPHQFLDQTEQVIVCAMHMALFEIQTGVCTYGPCRQKKLRSLPIQIIDHVVWVALDS